MANNVVTNTRFNCGCGFTTYNQKEAEKHVSETGHIMGVLGSVYKDTPKVNGLATRPRVRIEDEEEEKHVRPLRG